MATNTRTHSAAPVATHQAHVGLGAGAGSKSYALAIAARKKIDTQKETEHKRAFDLWWCVMSDRTWFLVQISPDDWSMSGVLGHSCTCPHPSPPSRPSPGFRGLAAPRRPEPLPVVDGQTGKGSEVGRQHRKDYIAAIHPNSYSQAPGGPASRWGPTTQTQEAPSSTPMEIPSRPGSKAGRRPAVASQVPSSACPCSVDPCPTLHNTRGRYP